MLAKVKEKKIRSLILMNRNLSLGENKSERQEAYGQHDRDTIPEGEIKLIRDALQRGQLTGSERFRQELCQRRGIRISNKGPGRPRKKQK